VIKYDVNGNLLWGWNNEGGSDQYLYLSGLILDSSQNAYIEVNLLDSSGPYQTFKINSIGNSVWNQYNPTDNVTSLSSSLTLDSAGNVLITGKHAWDPYIHSSYGTYKIGTNGNYMWTNLYPADASTGSEGLALTTDLVGDVFVAGNSTNYSTGYNCITTVGYDNSGNQKWLQKYSGPGIGNVGDAIAVDNSGSVYVAGCETETNGFTSMILIKYAPVAGQKQSNGNFILHAYGSPGESFDLQASTNLQTWQDLGSVIADTNGVALFEDTNAPLFPNRFYYTVPQ
jgi:hypothetical protein